MEQAALAPANPTRHQAAARLEAYLASQRNNRRQAVDYSAAPHPNQLAEVFSVSHQRRLRHLNQVVDSLASLHNQQREVDCLVIPRIPRISLVRRAKGSNKAAEVFSVRRLRISQVVEDCLARAARITPMLAILELDCLVALNSSSSSRQVVVDCLEVLSSNNNPAEVAYLAVLSNNSQPVVDYLARNLLHLQEGSSAARKRKRKRSQLVVEVCSDSRNLSQQAGVCLDSRSNQPKAVYSANHSNKHNLVYSVSRSRNPSNRNRAPYHKVSANHPNRRTRISQR